MKKFFVMFAIAVAMVACNNSSEGSGTGDSTPKTGDSAGINSGTSTGTGDSLNQGINDSLNKNTNDSANKTNRDSAKTK